MIAACNACTPECNAALAFMKADTCVEEAYAQTLESGIESCGGAPAVTFTLLLPESLFMEHGNSSNSSSEGLGRRRRLSEQRSESYAGLVAMIRTAVLSTLVGLPASELRVTIDATSRTAVAVVMEGALSTEAILTLTSSSNFLPSVAEHLGVDEISFTEPPSMTIAVSLEAIEVEPPTSSDGPSATAAILATVISVCVALAAFLRRRKRRSASSRTAPSIDTSKYDWKELTSSSRLYELERGWVEHTDPQGRPYFYHAASGRTRWDPPLVTKGSALGNNGGSAIATPTAPAAPPVAPPANPWSLEAVMGRAEGLHALEAFCKAELSQESLAFVLDAQAWQQQWAERDPALRQATANAIIDQYLSLGAPMEVCLPRGYSMETPLSEGMFEDAMAHARSTLALDILPRFEETEVGAELKAKLVAMAPLVSDRPPASTYVGASPLDLMLQAEAQAKAQAEAQAELDESRRQEAITAAEAEALAQDASPLAQAMRLMPGPASALRRELPPLPHLPHLPMTTPTGQPGLKKMVRVL